MVSQDISKSVTINNYLNTAKECIKLYYPESNDKDIEEAIKYSIQKRVKDTEITIANSYKKTRQQKLDAYGNPITNMMNEPQFEKVDKTTQTTLLKISDYIISRQPIVTAFGTMFMHHGTVPNPLMETIQSFLDQRTAHKKKMFTFPKGSEDFEKYNLLQSLTI